MSDTEESYGRGLVKRLEVIKRLEDRIERLEATPYSIGVDMIQDFLYEARKECQLYIGKNQGVEVPKQLQPELYLRLYGYRGE